MEDELPALSLEELARQLEIIEDSAWAAGSRSAALEFIVANLLIELDKRKVIDGISFIEFLETAVPKLGAPAQLAVKPIFEQLRLCVGGKVPDGYVLH